MWWRHISLVHMGSTGLHCIEQFTNISIWLLYWGITLHRDGLINVNEDGSVTLLPTECHEEGVSAEQKLYWTGLEKSGKRRKKSYLINKKLEFLVNFNFNWIWLLKDTFKGLLGIHSLSVSLNGSRILIICIIEHISNHHHLYQWRVGLRCLGIWVTLVPIHMLKPVPPNTYTQYTQYNVHNICNML